MMRRMSDVGSQAPESIWGPLRERYEGKRPRCLLSLDGGGMRGIIALEKLEADLGAATGRGEQFRLSDFFDYVAGTSTGALLAMGIARGWRVSEIYRCYVELGPKLFTRAPMAERLQSIYRAEPLEIALKQLLGEDTTLEPEYLRCLLLVVTRNASTDSPWPISSNPLALFNSRDQPGCNLEIPLWKLARASAAAPILFPPEPISFAGKSGEERFMFVDGAVTPYNNPAFLLYRMATTPEYRLGWEGGERNLLLVSIGTGDVPYLESRLGARADHILRKLRRLPSTLIRASVVDQDINCRVTGRCVHGRAIDLELNDLIPRDAAGERIPLNRDLGRAFLYARYDIEVSERGFEECGVQGVDVRRVRDIDRVDVIEELSEIGRCAARQIDLKELGPIVGQ